MSQPHDEWFHKIATLRVDMLPETERAAFEEHIKSCVPCQEQISQYRVIDESLQRYFALPVLTAEPPLLPVGLQAQVREHQRSGVGPEWRGALMQRKQVIMAFVMQSMSIALAVGLITFALGMYIVHMPGINIAIITPLADIAIAAVILGLLMRRSLVFREEWSNPTSSGRSYLTPARGNHVFVPSHGETSELMPGIDEPLPVRTPGSVGSEKNWRDRGRLLIISLILLAVGLASLSISLLNPAVSQTRVVQSSNSSVTVPVPPAPIGISSTGDRIFDISSDRKDLELKQAAAHDIAQGNTVLARQEWKEALAVDSSDTEALIYLENLQVHDEVQSAPSRFTARTLVVFTTLSQEHIGGGRDILQGAYVAQKEHNQQVRQSGGVLLRLLLAVTNKDDASILKVTHQVVDAANHDPSILGIMGLPTSKIATVAYPLLARAHLPMISPTASSEALSGVSDYFYRIAPPDELQGRAGANYAKNTLHAKTVALFVNESDPYSTSLAQAFESSFSDLQHHVAILSYQQGQPESIEADFKRAEELQIKPDLIYFAGFVNDASVVLNLLPDCKVGSPCLKVMGGDALYVQGDYSLEAYKRYARLIFTAFAFSDAWKVQGIAQEPAFFEEYTQAFDPTGQYQVGKYGFNRADADAILAYDAMQAFLHGMGSIEAGQNVLTPATMQQALRQLDRKNAFQGVSRKIGFTPDGNPIDGQVVILVGGANNQTTLVSIEPGKK